MTSITNFSQNKIISATNLILFILIVPKIDIVSFTNFHQGIRIENLLSLIFFFLILFNPKKFKINYSDKFFIFCGVIILSYVVGELNEFSLSYITIIRILEYIILYIFFSNYKLDYGKIINIFKILIIINVIVCLLQYYNIVGFFSSRGYFEANYTYWKAAGIFSGSWEVSFISSLLYFVIYHHEKKKINIYFFLTLIILYLANTRGVMISFFLSVFILYFRNFKISLLYLFLTPLILYLFYFLVLKYFSIDIVILFESIIRLIFFNQNIFEDLNKFGNQYYSWGIRLGDWLLYANQFNTNIFTNLFGTGYTAIYYESFIFRILFANGFIGFLILSILIIRIKFYMIIFLLLTGFTLDFVVSFKMFVILFLYFKYLKFLKK